MGDDEKTCSKAVEMGEAFSKLRMYALGGPLFSYCKALQSGKALTDNFDFKLRRDTHCWIVPKGIEFLLFLAWNFPLRRIKLLAIRFLPNFWKCDGKKICRAVQ